MFRLKGSHLQALTAFSLPDALPTLKSHIFLQFWNTSGYNFQKRFFIYKVFYLQIVFKH